ncbi:MAG: type II toxin-antitoxin system Phd/YefM family antitoxin [Terriglobales bacterium]
MKPGRVGARELKARLGTYLRQVRQGRSLIITERGEPVAELRPLAAADSVEAALAEMEARGEMTRGVPGPLTPLQPIRSRKPLSQTIMEDREDRW